LIEKLQAMEDNIAGTAILFGYACMRPQYKNETVEGKLAHSSEFGRQFP
jgi:hypothetical protein